MCQRHVIVIYGSSMVIYGPSIVIYGPSIVIYGQFIVIHGRLEPRALVRYALRNQCFIMTLFVLD